MHKVLLIEDDGLMARMYQRFISLQEGYSVELASDGIEGFEKAKSFLPDLILLDIMMPRMNGLQTLEKLKNDWDTKDIPVIILSNLANKAEAELALKHGAVQWLVKSEYEPKEVLDIISTFFEHSISGQ